MAVPRPIHEVDFCAQVASAANLIVSQNPAAFPFREARVEGFGTGPARRKRKDLRFFDDAGKMVLCGEVKLPGTPEGRTPYDSQLCADAEAKAGNAGIRYFFTWNVNTFVLWDRSLWGRPLLSRNVWERRLPRTFSTVDEVGREENLEFIKTHFLPDLFRDLAEILSGRRRDWSMPPDDIFIRSLESHLDWPVQLARAYILEHASRTRAFDQQVQGWLAAQDRTFVRSVPEEWSKAVDNMAKTLAYVWANRLIFYKALRARFPDLPRLELRKSIKKPAEAVAALNGFFQRAVERSGDYEPLLMPEAKDWDAELVFHPENALDAWRGLLRGIESVDFREVPSDVVGRIFQKLIGPEERHRYGQHFTGDDVVDLINVFCIRSPGDAVLDPACGSGSFLVRAYYRKRHLQSTRPHLEMLGELFGCDIALYPAHLATLNLAAREINDEANYPRIVRRNFFDLTPAKPFCHVPDKAGGQSPVALPALDAVVGNPPYVRHEKIHKPDKKRFGELAAGAWRGLRLTGRSDLHCYFWPVATQLLKPEGYFGFLTSSSWLDVEYGFPLQGWLLRHFRILAIMESAAEPWFEDARVKTCATIVQRCEDETRRMGNPVRFVRFDRRLAEIIGVPPGQSEGARQAALEALRQRILGAEADYQDDDLRIIVKTQKDLWNDGVRAARIVGAVDLDSLSEEYENGEGPGEEEWKTADRVREDAPRENGEYRAGKWGRYLRAPDLYFEFMRRFRNRFVTLGEIASIRRGITSGCDAFFMPTDITARMLEDFRDEKTFPRHAWGAPRKEVASGKLKLVKAGDGSVHPIEAMYLAPELHSLMKVDRPVVRARELDRLVLLVAEPTDKLKATAPWVWRYLRYGATQPFAFGKSKPVPLPHRPTCKAREPWYNLTGLVKPGFAFWPKSQQYRHIIPANPAAVICNCNLYDVDSGALDSREKPALLAVLNSTLVGLFKMCYGRWAGTEGNLKTEVVDVNLLEIPDPRGVPAKLAKRLSEALERMSKREVGRLVEEQLMDCHTPERARKLAAGPVVLARELQQADRRDLDDAVLELLGVSGPRERADLVERLYEATARHFRDIRVVEIEKMVQRAKSDGQRFSVHDLAADVWDAAALEDATPLAEWIGHRPESDTMASIPDEHPASLSDDVMFSPNIVYFGRERKTFVDCPSRGQAELVVRLARLGVAGDVRLPKEHHACYKLLDRVHQRISKAREVFWELVASRTSDEAVRAQLMELLLRWFVLGRAGNARDAPEGADPQAEQLSLRP